MIGAIAALTWMRVRRGRALWVGAVIAAMPVLYALVARSRGLDVRAVNLLAIEELLFAVLPALFVAASIGEDIEDRTATYLWSRPLPRWTIVAGKLCTLVPVAVGFQLASMAVASLVAGNLAPLGSFVGLAAGVVAVSLVATGIALLVPRYGMALTLCYVLLFDLVVGALPASLREASIGYQAQQLAGGDIASPLAAMATVGAVWLGVGLWRLRRIEA